MTLAPNLPLDRHANRNVALLFGVPILLVLLALTPWFVHHWVERAGASDIQDAATLPTRITACGRSWHRPDAIMRTSLDVERARSGVEPVVVDIAPFAPCPDGRCTRVGEDTPCATVVFVRIGQADYVAFDLLGGP